MTLVETLAAQLAALGLATGVARSSLLYAAASATHLLGIAFIIAPVVMLDLALLGILGGLDERARATLRVAIGVGLALALTSGLLLLSSKPAEYFTNWAFLAKVFVVALALVNAAAFEWRARTGTPPGRWSILASIGLWLSALMLGRWIAFV